MAEDIESSLVSPVGASNTSPVPDGFPAGSSPNVIYTVWRELQAKTRRFWDRLGATQTSGGSANAQTLTFSPASLLYKQGDRYSFKAGFTNTGATTLNVDGLGTKSIFADNRALAGGEIQTGMVVEVQYDGTQFQIMSRQPLASAPYGFKNLIINGDFQIQQRSAGGALSMGISASSTGVYTFDRWCITTGANQASGVFATTGANLSSGALFAAVIQRTAGQTGTSTMQFQCPLTTDQLATIRGKIVTLSFKISLGATFITNNSGGVNCALFMGTGAEGKRGAGFSSESSTCTTNSTANGTVIATSAAIVPTTTTQGCILFTWTPTATAGATDQVVITDVQLEVGGVATSFDRRPFDVELLRCQRFYQKSFAYNSAPIQNFGGAGSFVWRSVLGSGAASSAGIPFQTRMRTAPSCTLYNPSAANAQVRDSSGGLDCSSSSAAASSNDMYLNVNTTLNASSTANAALIVHWTADAEL